MIGNECGHTCMVCDSAYSHWPRCDGPMFDVCWVCVKQGYMLVCCDRCDQWKPSKKGLVCEDCGKVRVVA